MPPTAVRRCARFGRRAALTGAEPMQSHLYRRDATYYWRRLVPKNYHQILGARDLGASLRTNIPEAARSRASQMDAAFDLALGELGRSCVRVRWYRRRSRAALRSCGKPYPSLEDAAMIDIGPITVEPTDDDTEQRWRVVVGQSKQRSAQIAAKSSSLLTRC